MRLVPAAVSSRAGAVALVAAAAGWCTFVLLVWAFFTALGSALGGSPGPDWLEPAMVVAAVGLVVLTVLGFVAAAVAIVRDRQRAAGVVALVLLALPVLCVVGFLLQVRSG